MIWQGCYEDSWKDLIVDEAFSHPAKFARGLIRRIYEHAIERGYVRPGGLVVDPFGGVALGALDAMNHGIRHLAVELEPRFVALAQRNLDLWAKYGLTGAAIVQGDSRELCRVVAGADCVVGSPPFQESVQVFSKELWAKDRAMHGRSPDCKHRAEDYGTTPGQLGAMKPGSVEAVIDDESRRDYHVKPSAVGRTARPFRTAGEEPGPQSCPADVIISSPPYANSMESGDKQAHIDFSKCADGRKWKHSPGNQGSRSESYSTSPANLGNLPPGSVDSVISSPPYAEQVIRKRDAGHHEPNRQGAMRDGSHSHDAYGQTPGQLASLPPGSLDQVVDAVVGSPPYEGSLQGTRPGKCSIDDSKMKHPRGASTMQKHGNLVDAMGYSENDSNLGNQTGGTFWEAARQIVAQCHAILKPNGIAIWVCKDFVRGGKRVPFSADWCRLCEAEGFTLVEWIKASLVKEQREPGLFGEDVVHTTSRKGFFRRLAESKGSPPIDHEDVLILRKT